MAVESGASPTLAIRSNVGIELWESSGFKLPFEPKPQLPREDTKIARSITFSPDGQYLAYTNGVAVKLLATANWQLICSLPRPKASYIKFSPRGNYLVTWELYTTTKDNPNGAPNMYVYRCADGVEVYATVQKKQTDWEPSWASDESIFALMVGGEALFYELGEGGKGFTAYEKKLGGGRGGVLSLSPSNSPPYLAFYTPGVKGAPSMCKIYKYPALDANQTIACKSFFQADRVEMMWNKRGTGLLIMTSTEVDKTGASYYGNQALHFMSTKGDSCAVSLKKEGAVHSVEWSPKSTEFIVVYGYMPAKATLFNLKCDVVHDFAEAPRNCAYFNNFGNMLILAGFGNLRGNVEIWDLNKKTKISSLEAPDSTYLEWNPNGEHFLTATTAPRLRIANGFKVWHYSGALLHETLWPAGQELYSVEWQKYAEGVFKENQITKSKVEGIKSSQPVASKQVYRPPSVRLMGEGKNPADFISPPVSTIPGLPPGYTSANAKSNGNRQKKPRTKKPNNTNNSNQNSVEEVPSSASIIPTAGNTTNNNRPAAKTRPPRARKNTASEDKDIEQNDDTPPQLWPKTEPINYADNEKKKQRLIRQKLYQISKLKNRQDNGETLQLTQLSKIAREAELIEELNVLKISP